MHRTELLLPIIPITATDVVTSGINVSQEETGTASEIVALVITTTATTTSVTREEASSPNTANLTTALVITTLHGKDSKNIRWGEEEEEEDPPVIAVTHVETITRVVVSILITNLGLSPPAAIPFLLLIPVPVPVQLSGEIPLSPTSEDRIQTI